MSNGPRRAVFVAAADSSIGRTVALRFAAAAVAVVDIDRDGAIVVTAKIAGAGAGGAAVAGFGGLDWAANNAGASGGAPEPDDCADPVTARVLAVNVTGTWRCMKHQVRQMQTPGSGANVDIASVAGLVGVGGRAHVASKYAVVSLTKAAGARFAAQVCPGALRTPMLEQAGVRRPGMIAGLADGQPRGRLSEPEEIADGVFWRCSNHASYVAGQAIAVDGGYTSI